MTNNIIASFFEFINTLRVSGDIAVGVSGGPDSLALTTLLSEWCQNRGNKLVALTVDHNLRAESAQEAYYTHSIMQSLGIEHHILTWQDGRAELSNLSHKARKARLRLLTDWCKQNAVPTLAVAHTKNDIVETFFINIFRGSGLDGLASIPADNTYNGVRIIRPVSIFTKAELMQYLSEKQIQWVEDPSNTNDKFLRGRLRKIFAGPDFRVIFPSEEAFLNRIITNVDNIKRAKSFMDDVISKAKANIVQLFPEGYVVVDRSKFIELHQEISLHLLADCLITVSGSHEYKPRLHSLQNLYENICTKDSVIATLWSCEIKITQTKIYIYKEVGREKAMARTLNDGSVLWDERFIIQAQADVKIRRLNAADLKALQKQGYKLHLPLKKIYYTLPVITAAAGHHVPFLMPAADGLQVYFRPTILLI